MSAKVKDLREKPLLVEAGFVVLSFLLLVVVWVLFSRSRPLPWRTAKVRRVAKVKKGVEPLARSISRAIGQHSVYWRINCSSLDEATKVKWKCWLGPGASIEEIVGKVSKGAQANGWVASAHKKEGRALVELSSGGDNPRERVNLEIRLRKRRPVRSPCLAIVIDDVGNSKKPLEPLASIGVTLTFSVLPRLPNSAYCAKWLAQRGFEVLLHLPMEGGNSHLLGPGAIFVKFTEEEVRRTFMANLGAIPEAEGFNNHMGSLASASERICRGLVKLAKDRGLFVLDSKTTPKALLYDIAVKEGIPAISNDLHLDHPPDIRVIKQRLARLKRIAKGRGYAVGIAHPNPETISVLQEVLPRWAREGVNFVSAGDLALAIFEKRGGEK